jgi:hypothetical protein
MPKLTAEQRAELRAEVQRVRTILRGASVPKDIFGKRMVVPATCGIATDHGTMRQFPS